MNAPVRPIMPRSPRPVTPRLAVCLAVGLAGCAASAFGWDAPSPGEVQAYRRAFAAAAGQRFTAAADLAAFVAQCRAGRVLWLGDHHRSPALHAEQLALLQALRDRGVPLALLLEAVGTQDQPAVDRYLAGRLSLDGLAAAVAARWPGSWLGGGEQPPDVDAAHYRGLLALARDAGLPVRALEPTPRRGLAARDAAIATAVRDAAVALPDRLLCVVVGQSHLGGQGDLPRRTGLPGVALGGEPPEPLRGAAPPTPAGAPFWRSDAGFWWFASRCRAAPPPQPRAAGAAPSCFCTSSAATR